MAPDEIATKHDIDKLYHMCLKMTELLTILLNDQAAELVTITEAGKRLNCGYDRVKTLTRKGHIKGTPDGKITVNSINAYLGK